MSWFVFVVVYGIYVLTSFLSVPGGDSGELLAEACLSGVSHPPGYPLFQLLSNAILSLPDILHPPRLYLDHRYKGNISATGTVYSWNGVLLDMQPSPAWRVNHMCSLFGATTAGLMSASIGMLLKSTITSTQPISTSLISTLGAFLFALSPLVWEYMIGTEVFALNNLLCAMLVYMTICICHMNNTKTNDLHIPSSTLIKSDFLVCLGALVCGASLANQHASLLFTLILVPSILLITMVFPLFSASSQNNGSKSSISTVTTKTFLLVSSAMCFFIGLGIPYRYLMYTSKTPRPGSWGDITDINGLFRHMLRSEYGTFQLGATRSGGEAVALENVYERIWLYIEHTNKESYYLAFPIALLGILSTMVVRIPTKLPQQKDEPQKMDNKQTIEKPITDSKRKRNPDKPSSSSSSSSKQGNDMTQNNNSTMNTISYTLTTPPMIVWILLLTWMLYVVIWHAVLSNLPLSSPMGYAVHSRFWMQPNIIVHIFVGVGIGHLASWITSLSQISQSNITSPSQTSSSNNYNSNVWKTSIELGLIVIAITIIIQHRYTLLDRSNPVDAVMKQYGMNILDSLPPQSLLVSSTDLDWNSVRYFQSCEHIRTDIVHLNFQLMPFSWFAHRQQPLYPTVKFPPLLPGVSTSRSSEGNAMLVHRFLIANGASELSISSSITSFDEKNKKNKKKKKKSLMPFPGGIYIDMQAINEIEIGEVGQWRGLVLLPWGTLYRVLGPLQYPPNQPTYQLETGLKDIMSYQCDSLQRLHHIRRNFPAYNARKFVSGSWEYAAYSVYYDGHYQLGLHLLTWAIEVLKHNELVNQLIPFVLNRLYVASMLLTETLDTVLSKGTLSSPTSDLYKNVALGWMRLSAIVQAMAEHGSILEQQLQQDPSFMPLLFSWSSIQASSISPDKDIPVNILVSPMTPLRIINQRKEIHALAHRIISGFIKEYPTNPDMHVFRTFVETIQL